MYAFAPAIAVLAAVIIGGIQLYLQRKQQQQDLFDKRFDVYDAVRTFLSSAQTSSGPLDNQQYDLFLSRTKSAKFLFGSDVMVFLAEIHCQISHQENTDNTIERFIEPSDTDEEGDPLTTVWRLSAAAEPAFHDYLQIHHDRWFPGRLYDAINRWMDSEVPAKLATRNDA